nr:MAG TPA: hypothetical protein [Caudoviricetes sp.]
MCVPVPDVPDFPSPGLGGTKWLKTTTLSPAQDLRNFD